MAVEVYLEIKLLDEKPLSLLRVDKTLRAAVQRDEVNE